MLNKAALLIFSVVSLVSIHAFAAEDESKDTNLACKDCILVCGCEDHSEEPPKV
jgi:hypothetical protein